MPLTIFYSWQTDTPARLNRSFIEDALKRALRQINASADVVNSERREELKLDKDTMGLPGTPPIVEAIFKKIDGCAVFVPDVTFVAKTDAGRPTPNANVLIEYGWALKSRGHERIVAVMNDAFGEPSWNSLPFNVRHVRWPIRYTLLDGADATARADVRNQLVNELAKCIRTVLDSLPVAPEPTFEQTPSTYDKATFFEQKERLAIRHGRISELDENCYVSQGPKMFLRLIPTIPTPEITPKRAYTKITDGGLQPFALPRIRGGEWCDRNKYGAIIFRTAPDVPTIEQLTQLFKNSEIWGVNAELDHIRSQVGCGVLLSGYEDAFIRALDNYLNFASKQLHLKLPLRLVAGITGIEGFRMAAPPGMHFSRDRYGGRAVERDIIFETRINDWKATPTETLKPFFERVWEAFGLERPDPGG